MMRGPRARRRATAPFALLKPRLEIELKRLQGLAESEGLDADEVYGQVMKQARPVASKQRVIRTAV